MKKILLVCLVLLVSCSKNSISPEEKPEPTPTYTYKFTNNTTWSSVKVKANISQDIQDFNLLSGESKIIDSKNKIENISIIDAIGTVNLKKSGNCFDIKLGAYVEIIALAKVEVRPVVNLYYYDNDNKTVEVKITTNRIIELKNFTNDRIYIISDGDVKVRVNGNEKNTILSSYYSETKDKIDCKIKDIIKN